MLFRLKPSFPLLLKSVLTPSGLESNLCIFRGTWFSSLSTSQIMK